MHRFTHLPEDINAKMVGIGVVVITGEVVIRNRPSEDERAHHAIVGAGAGARTDVHGCGWVFARDARGAPIGELALAAQDYQQRARGNIGVGIVAKCGWVEVIGGIVDNIFWSHAVVFCHAVQAFAGAPAM